MESVNERVLKKLSFLGSILVDEILEHSQIQEIPAGTELLREEQYIKVLPLVLDGLVKVHSRYDDKELLLYYIKPKQSCVMSFASSLKNQPSRIYATTVQDSLILILPTQKVHEWTEKYPQLSQLFYEQYDLRYAELLETIHHLLFDAMDKRIFDYLNQKSQMLNQSDLKISHSEIAKDLGTAREVVSRVMKRLESEGKVIQQYNLIKIL